MPWLAYIVFLLMAEPFVVRRMYALSNVCTRKKKKKKEGAFLPQWVSEFYGNLDVSAYLESDWGSASCRTDRLFCSGHPSLSLSLLFSLPVTRIF